MNTLELTIKKYLALGPNQRRVVALSSKKPEDRSPQDIEFIENRYHYIYNRHYHPNKPFFDRFDKHSCEIEINLTLLNEGRQLTQKAESLNLAVYACSLTLAAFINLIGGLGGGMHIVRDEDVE